MKRFIIAKGGNLNVAQNACDAIHTLDPAFAHVIEIKQYRKKRSVDQNAFLHGVPLKMISDTTGYEIEDMKTYLLGEFSGWTEYEVWGQLRKRPNKRSHELNTKEFTEFLDFIQRWAAQELGLLIPNPNEVIT